MEFEISKIKLGGLIFLFLSEIVKIKIEFADSPRKDNLMFVM